MKEKIVDEFDYPYEVVKGGVSLRTCPHGGHFDKSSHNCAICESVEECLWIQKNDECAANERKSTDELLESLLFPLDYIDMQLARAGHNIGLCSCEACSWLRDTEALVNTYSER